MTDDISVNYSTTIEATPVSGANTAPLAEPLVAFADCELIGIDSQRMLVINRVNGKQQFFQPGVVEALKTCTTFNTIAGHTETLCSSRPELQGQNEAVKQTLQQLHAAGFLLQGTEIAARLSATDSIVPAPSRIFIITCDRPEAVERLLESMLRNINLGAHDSLYLIDDSRQPENQAANRDLVEGFNIRSPKDLQYFGPEEQEKELERLVSELPEHETGIRFLLDRTVWEGKKTYGKSRTWCLLRSVGYRAIVMDDDILCESIAPPVRKDGISFKGEREVAFYKDREELLQSAGSTGLDPVAAHLEVLGQSLATTLSAHSDGELDINSLKDCNAAMLNELAPDHPILITQCGSWGDPGTGSAHWAFNMNEASIERLVSAPGGMVNALENRSSWFGCPRPTLHKMAFMSQMTGVDNKQLLPPYFPAFRGEDLMFATMVEAMFPNGMVFEHDWCVPHLPVDNRSLSVNEAIVGEGGIVLFTRKLVESIDYKDRTTPERRLETLANQVRDLATRSENDLLIDYRTAQAKGQADLLLQLRTRYQQAQQLPSSNWQGYIKRALEEAENSIAEIHSPEKIKGVDGNMTESELVSEFRRYADGWADALDAWPKMRAIC